MVSVASWRGAVDRRCFSTGGHPRRALILITLVIGLCACAGREQTRMVGQEPHLTARIFLDELTRLRPPLRHSRGVYGPGLTLTKNSEGFRPRPYNDAAQYCTVGYGHLIRLAPCDGSEPPEFT